VKPIGRRPDAGPPGHFRTGDRILRAPSRGISRSARIRAPALGPRADVITSVREEGSWPLDRRPLYLTGTGLIATPPSAAGQITFGTRTLGACFEWTIPADTEITGPMALRLWVEADGTGDIDLFAGVEQWHGRTYIPFEGSYGFGRDRITTSWLKASLRAFDEQASRPFDRFPPSPGPRRWRSGRSSRRT
jgi:predicted acyl esterase